MQGPVVSTVYIHKETVHTYLHSVQTNDSVKTHTVQMIVYP